MIRKFSIIGRARWHAQRPKKRTYDQWSNGITAVVHHSAGFMPRTQEEEIREMQTVQRYHFSQGWSDIGYNYVIMPSGRVYEGRGFNIVGAHTLDHNTGTVGICFAGNYDVRKPTRRSLRSYRLLIAHLRKNGAKIRRVRGHCQMPNQNTACPGKYLIRRLGL